MRELLVVILIASMAAACTKRSGATAPSTATRGDVAEVSDVPAPEVPNPPAIVRLANAYFASRPPGQRPKDAEWARDNFVRNFFAGFTNYTGDLRGADPAALEGFKTGQEFRRANPDRVKETFESFGYVATEAEGVWTTGFEHSGFKPWGRGDDEWWLSGMADTVYDLPEDEEIPAQGITIRISGYLSPVGRYGHSGAYKREFYATRISKSNGSSGTGNGHP